MTTQAATMDRPALGWLKWVLVAAPLAILPMVVWGSASTIGPGLVIVLQGLLWLGFAWIVYKEH